MSREKDDENLLRMTKDDLQRWIQAEVDRNPHLMQRREQLAQVEEWVKQKERDGTCTRLLYSNACESVLECESVMKGLYALLGLDYRDEDSEEEGGGGQPHDVIQIADDEAEQQGNVICNGEDDDDLVVIDLGATKETLEPMLEKVTVAIQKSSKLVQDLVQMVSKTSSMGAASPLSTSSSDINRPSSSSTPEIGRPESVTPKLEITNSITIVKTESLSSVPKISSLFNSSEQCNSITDHDSYFKPTIKTEPEWTPLTPWEDSHSSPFEKLIKTEPQSTVVTPLVRTPNKQPELSFQSTTKIKSEPQSTQVNTELSSPPSSSKLFENHNSLSIAAIKNESQLKASVSEVDLLESDSEQSDILCFDNKAATKARFQPSEAASSEITASSKLKSSHNSASALINRTDPKVRPVTPSGTPPPSKSPPAVDNTASTNQTDLELTKETPVEESTLPRSPEEAENMSDVESTDKTEKPQTRSKSARPSVVTTSPESELRSSKSPPVTKTSSAQKETARAQSPSGSIDESADMEDSPDEPSNSPPVSPTKTPDKTSSNDAPAKSSKAKKSSKHSSSESSKALKEIKLKVGAAVLGKKRHNHWSRGTVQEVETEDNGNKYKVEFKKGKTIVLSANHVAAFKPPSLKDLYIGCRVVASAKSENGKSLYNAGVMVELPERKNRMRFLVFFDDGLATYLALPDLYFVCKQTKKVWRDIKDESSRKQVKDYLQVYPNPIAVVLRLGQETKAVRNGQFEDCTVLQLDGSLVQICYKNDKQKEWIYKGSDKLEHILTIKNRHKQFSHKKHHSPEEKTQSSQPKTLHSSKSDTVSTSTTSANASSVSSDSVSPARVIRQNDKTKTSSISPQKIMSPAFQPKVVLQKISLPSPVSPAASVSKSNTNSSLISAKRPAPDEEDECFSEEEVEVLEQNKSVYLHQRCCPACLEEVRPHQVDIHHGKNPLLIPLLFKFRRMTARRRIDGKLFFHIFYRSPCGRSLCDMQEVQEYLFETRCDFLFLEMFCMDPFVLVNRARPPSTTTGQPHLYLPDISEGKEVMPVPCVNEVDNTLAPNVTYTKDRVPARGVFINTSSDFMVGCDCTDGCRDRSKCACHKLTVEATSLCTGGPVDVSAGYTHKRLPTSISTGVYECNPLCRCDPKMCSNRLVQHGMQLRLELFMTQHKGWGIRCRDDVAKGTFVCVFTGKIVNEDKMNEDDTVSGNEYLANLDFIEGVEKLKEGYESEAYCSDTEVESSKKTITMKTGPLLKNSLYKEDSSSGEEPMEVDTAKVQVKVHDKHLDERKPPNKPHETLKDTRKKICEPRRNDGQEASGPKRCFAIKSFQRRVKPLETTDAQNEKAKRAPKNTRGLFNDEDACYVIDARQEGNLGRYINHSCSPNLFVQNVFVDTHDLRFPWVAFFASKRIKAGTELTWDYNYEVGSVEGKVLLCCCGSLRCTGRLL
ncbi:histone-lysine N-methyltransferase SETDB1-A isoform X2 [Danio aesculapii]|uniref:histone-lysine N-methyltransferase SETDB1-A isoform X2 n=1 Tax=Danio aesculapii TaxID=1142201 RepID=UPI0024C0319C|nr:histone-lysine N-methyltransferase SETDB1-A isoform X2 [Danio aesculapii]